MTRSSLVADGLKRSFEGSNPLFTPHGQGFGLEIAVWALIALGLREEPYKYPRFPACPENLQKNLVELST